MKVKFISFILLVFFMKTNANTTTDLLLSLNSTQGFIMDGSALTAMSNAGDVNGDGIDDIIVGAPGGMYKKSTAYVLYGKKNLTAQIAVSNTGWDLSQGFMIKGNFPDMDNLGVSVSRAGDINGDGIDDVIVGANTATADGRKGAGAAYVIYGKKNGLTAHIDLSTPLNLTAGFMIKGGAEYDEFGYSVNSAGDVNGDGIIDLIFGAQRASPNEISGAGIAYVIYGKKVDFAAHIDLSTPLNLAEGFMIKGVDNNGQLGCSVSDAGDVNNDGIGDVIVGANYASPDGRTGAGAAYVIYGKKKGLTSHIDLSIPLNLVQGFMIKGNQTNGFLGISVSAAGDMNSDGIGDIIVGNNGIHTTGTAYVIYGKKDGPIAHIDLSKTLDLAQGFMITAYPEDNLGISVSKGDFNGDGISDVIVGAPRANPNGLTEAGIVYAIYGRKDSFTAHVSLTTALDPAQGFMIKGTSSSAKSGNPVSGAGDVNGDGIDDVILYGSSTKIYVLYSSCDIGYYFSSNGRCIECPHCNLCTITGCQDCKSSFSLYSTNGKCYATGNCPSGTYENNAKCLNCSTPNCAKCTETQCQACKNGFSLYSPNGNCYATGACPPRTYENNSKCIDCSDANCDVCTTDGCQTCKNGFSLYSKNGNCYATGNCPSGTYQDSGKCIDCSDANCAKCTTTDCQACKNGFSLYSKNGNCYAAGNCPSGTYENNAKCFECSNPNCAKCTDTDCQACKNGFSLYPSTGKCYVTETCPSRTYEDNGKCIDCSDANCDICTNIGCQTCKNGYVLDTTQRTCSACPLGTYESDNKCLDCSDPNCNKCTNTECQGCKKGYLLDSEKGICASKSTPVRNSVATASESASDSTFFTPSTIVAIVLPVVEGIAILFLAVQLIKLRTALMRRRPIRIEPVSTQVSPTPRLSTKSVNYYPSPRLSTKSDNYSPKNGA